jgi:photosystem II stability/assembly factor-like uncharacterized protein
VRGLFAAAVALLTATALAPAHAAEQPAVLTWLHMVDGSNGWALGGRDTSGDTLLHTSDGGSHWTVVRPGIHSNAVTVARRTILFSTTLRGGRFAVERSDDNGRTWRRSLPFGNHAGGIGRPLRADDRHLYVAVGEGVAAGSSAQALYVSRDGGRRWRFVSRTSFAVDRPGTLPFGCDKNGFGFSTPQRGWAGAICAGGPPFFYRTDDGGATWRRQALPGPTFCQCSTLPPSFFTRRQGVFAVTGYDHGRTFTRIFWTGDGGRTWRARTARTGRAELPVFADARTAWFAATPPDRYRNPFDRLYRTIDAGRTWHIAKLPFDGQNYALDPVDGTLAFAYRLAGGSLLRTNDGGRTWKEVRPLLSR